MFVGYDSQQDQILHRPLGFSQIAQPFRVMVVGFHPLIKQKNNGTMAWVGFPKLSLV